MGVGLSQLLVLTSWCSLLSLATADQTHRYSQRVTKVQQPNVVVDFKNLPSWSRTASASDKRVADWTCRRPDSFIGCERRWEGSVERRCWRQPWVGYQVISRVLQNTLRRYVFYLELIRTGRPDEESYLRFAGTRRARRLASCRDQRSGIHFWRFVWRSWNPCGDSTALPWLIVDQKLTQQYLRSEEEMCELFSDIPEALENSVEIVAL